jgi:uncharacterized membrane protein
MTASIVALFLAQLGFVGGHFLLSHPPVRTKLVARLGEAGFSAGYSLIMAAFLVWTVLAYRGAPTMWLWNLGAAGRWVPALLMPPALILAVVGLTTRSVTAVGGESVARSPQVTKGIATITRHPFLWGAALWAIAHLAANGDLASLVLFGGILVLALGGMAAIDHKRALKLGADWNRMAHATSAIPFAAALSGRTTLDWAGIGWLRPLVAIVIYFALFHGHRWLFGVSALPGG